MGLGWSASRSKESNGSHASAEAKLPTETGEAHRALASSHATRRSRYSAYAAAAQRAGALIFNYLNKGRPELAGQLRLKARAERTAMEACNARAARALLCHLNRGHSPHKLDLHYLFVREACDAVRQRVAELRAAHDTPPDERHLVCVVGQGLHSDGGVARLKPAVHALALQLGLRVTAGRPNAGCLFVEWDVAEQDAGLVGWVLVERTWGVLDAEAALAL